jgi:hypothetical protein
VRCSPIRVSANRPRLRRVVWSPRTYDEAAETRLRPRRASHPDRVRESQSNSSASQYVSSTTRSAGPQFRGSCRTGADRAADGFYNDMTDIRRCVRITKPRFTQDRSEFVGSDTDLPVPGGTDVGVLEQTQDQRRNSMRRGRAHNGVRDQIPTVPHGERRPGPQVVVDVSRGRSDHLDQRVARPCIDAPPGAQAPTAR